MTNYIVGEDVFAELNSENINKSYIFNTKKLIGNFTILAVLDPDCSDKMMQLSPGLRYKSVQALLWSVDG